MCPWGRLESTHRRFVSDGPVYLITASTALSAYLCAFQAPKLGAREVLVFLLKTFRRPCVCPLQDKSTYVRLAIGDLTVSHRHCHHATISFNNNNAPPRSSSAAVPYLSKFIRLTTDLPNEGSFVQKRKAFNLFYFSRSDHVQLRYNID